MDAKEEEYLREMFAKVTGQINRLLAVLRVNAEGFHDEAEALEDRYSNG